MKYLCLCYYDAEKEARLSQEELAAIGPACKPHDAALRATGKVVVQGSLAPYQERSRSGVWARSRVWQTAAWML